MSHITSVVPAKAGTHSPCVLWFALSLVNGPQSRVVSKPLRSMGPRLRGDDQLQGQVRGVALP